MRQWLPYSVHLPPFSALLDTMAAAYFFSYTGLLLDLVAFPLLLWRKTRALMIIVLLFFHFANSQLFANSRRAYTQGTPRAGHAGAVTADRVLTGGKGSSSNTSLNTLRPRA